MKPVSIVLPTYNEKDNILPLILAINKEFSPCQIIVVDDDSPDGTVDEVLQQQKKLRNVKVIKNIPRLGLTKSIQKGIYASKGKFVAWMDADFSHPPKVLNHMYQTIQHADIVVGSWLMPGGKDKRKEKFTLLYSLVINKLCQFFFGSFVHTYTSGFAMIHKPLFKNFRLRGDYGEYFIDFLVRNKRAGKTIIEIPFNCVSRKKGSSKTAPNFYKFLQRSKNYIITLLSLQRIQRD